ncbi:MAG: thioredoxin domain-containing protein [bacterium]
MKITNEAKITIGLLVTTVLIIVGGAWLAGRGSSDEGENVSAAQASKLVPDGGTVLGASDAEVTVVEFADFQCPACKTFHLVMKEVMEERSNQSVRHVFRHFPLLQHEGSDMAAEASLAARAQGKFWEYADLLFEDKGVLVREDLERHAEELELNMDVFRASLDEGEFKDEVQRDVSDGKAIRVRATPSIYINGVQYRGQLLVEDVQAAIDAALQR